LNIGVVLESTGNVKVLARTSQLKAVIAPSLASLATCSSGRSAHCPVKSVTGLVTRAPLVSIS
jgi:hypothetical protein